MCARASVTCRGVTSSWECASTWTLLPHPTPPLRDVTHLQRSMTYVRTCKWTCRGVTSWECASTWTLLPHPTPPLRDVTHLQRSMTYVLTCKWTCRGVTSWECASTWMLLPHPTPPQGTYNIKMPKTLGRFSTRRHKHPFTSYFDVNYRGTRFWHTAISPWYSHVCHHYFVVSPRIRIKPKDLHFSRWVYGKIFRKLINQWIVFRNI